ncbi:MAG: GbsR/MarR family transcriptional regulator [Bacillota bacterium]
MEVVFITPEELGFIEDLGLLMERAGGARTLGRVFGYLLLSGRPKTLDQIAESLLFSKATASLTVRQGIVHHFFEKISIPGERKDYYRANVQSWINSMSDQVKIMKAWEGLIQRGLALAGQENATARENLEKLRDYLRFMAWYLSDIEEQYRLWKKGHIRERFEINQSKDDDR